MEDYVSGKRLKGDPIPTRFEQTELDFLDEVVQATGFSRSEIIRRSVRFACNAARETEETTYQFLISPVPRA